MTLLPQEIEVWHVIPAIRKGLVQELVKLGLSQKAAAEKLWEETAAAPKSTATARRSTVLRRSVITFGSGSIHLTGDRCRLIAKVCFAQRRDEPFDPPMCRVVGRHHHRGTPMVGGFQRRNR